MNLTLVIPLAADKGIEIEEISKQKIKHLEIYGSNPSKNRNKGVEIAKTKYVAFINGHTTLSENWIEEVEAFFNEHPEIDIVGGPQLTSENEPLFGRISGYALQSKFGAGGTCSRYSPTPLNLNANETMLTSANLICKRSVFNKIKFDENLYPGEDPKFITDALKNGLRVAYSPDIIVYNKRRDNIAALAKQVYYYGFVRAKKEVLIETIKKPTFLVPSIFLLYLVTWAIILLYLLVGLTPSLLFIISSIPLCFYILLSILFSIYAIDDWVKNSIRTACDDSGDWLIEDAHDSDGLYLITLLPLLFLTIHLSYGIGFIIGNLKWKILTRKH